MFMGCSLWGAVFLYRNASIQCFSYKATRRELEFLLEVIAMARTLLYTYTSFLMFTLECCFASGVLGLVVMSTYTLHSAYTIKV